MQLITASIVIYRDKIEILQKTIGSFLNTDLDVRLYIIDNSPSREAENICRDKRIEYIFNNKNLGFGAGHNIAIRRLAGQSKYHLVLNPDIFFEKGTLEALCNFIESDSKIGLIMPKICYYNNSAQHLCKLLPTPADLILRRFNLKILKILFKKWFENYELRFTGYNKIMDVPHLSGCFMFIRQDVFKKVGLFDERFFMYLEDIDFSRRVHRNYRTVYYPEIVAYHYCARASYSNTVAFKHHIISAVKYFNKWGWFFDEERQLINKKILEKCSNIIHAQKFD